MPVFPITTDDVSGMDESLMEMAKADGADGFISAIGASTTVSEWGFGRSCCFNIGNQGSEAGWTTLVVISPFHTHLF